MLGGILFYVCIIISAQAVSDDDALEENLCILPPYPKHGTYDLQEPEDLENYAPGDRLAKYILEVICEEGYVKSYNSTQTCLGGRKSDDEPAQCLQCGKFLELVQIVSGGRRATAFEAPWHAGIYTKTKRPYMQICGGTVVSTSVVISAAHCFWSEADKQLPARNYAIAAGKLYRPWNDKNDYHAQKSDVAEIKIPPRFQGDATSYQDDIAVVRLSSPFEVTQRVTPACLDFDLTAEREQLKDGSLGKVSGWGLTGEDADPSPVLKVVEMPVVRIEDCIAKSDQTFTRHITSDKICAGYTNGTSVCKGDSGGGLAFPKYIAGEARYFLRGVVSGAPSSERRCNTQAWATFTRVYHHLGFIRDHLRPRVYV